VGYSSARPASAEKRNVIVLQRSPEQQSEEVILGRSKRDTNYQRHRVTFEEAEPVDGGGYYNDYVIQNLQLAQDEKRKTPAGEVKLSFDVNDAGQAININVEKSLCKECDLEAIRLLKEGPKWVTKKKSKKRKVIIRF
jgi:hypothetical protein